MAFTSYLVLNGVLHDYDPVTRETRVSGRGAQYEAEVAATAVRNAAQDAANARQQQLVAAWAANPQLAKYAAQGYDFDSAKRLYDSGYDEKGYSGAAALAQNLATAAANPIIPAWSPGVVTGPVRGTTVLPTPSPPAASGPVTLPAPAPIEVPWRETRPILSEPVAIPAANTWVPEIVAPRPPALVSPIVETPRPPAIVAEAPVAAPLVTLNAKGEEGGPGMSLGSLLGNAAKGVLQSLPGGAILTAGATALLNSRKDGPPASVPGMPMVQQPGGLLNLPNPLLHPIDYVTQYGQSVMSAGQTLLQGPGGLGAVNPSTKSVTLHRCPKGYALAIDGKCYPKSMLSRQLRKWKPDPKPVVSRSDQKAIRRAASAKHRLVKVTRDAGAFASLHKPKHDAPKKRR